MFVKISNLLMLKKVTLYSQWNEMKKTVLQISNLFKVTSMSIQRFVKKYKHIFQYNIDAWSYYFSFYNTSLVNITVDLHANKKSNNLLGPSNKNCGPKQKTRCAFFVRKDRFVMIFHAFSWKKGRKKIPALTELLFCNLQFGISKNSVLTLFEF